MYSSRSNQPINMSITINIRILSRVLFFALISATTFEARTAEARNSLLSRDPNDVRFILFPNPESPSDFQEIFFNNSTSLEASSYNASKPSKFIIHGFLGDGFNGYEGFPRNVKDAYLAMDEDHSYNVFTVDWNKLADPHAGIFSSLFYNEAAKNVGVVGIRVGEFISWLHNQGKIDVSKTHIIPHSLGVHIGGWAGATVSNLTGAALGRISALDPPSLGFETDMDGRRIRPFDANFVDVYHTTEGPISLSDVVGTLDFFVNGGDSQPGCLDHWCRHEIATEYFAQTIMKDDPAKNSADVSRCVCMTKEKFKKDKNCCAHRFLFGEFARPGTAGKYYVKYLLDRQKGK